MTRTKALKLFLIISVSVPFLFFPPKSEAEALCIKDNRANLRHGPGTRYEKLWEVFKYMPFKKLAKKGDWYRVQDLDGDIFWVHKKLTTKKFKCAVVKDNKTNLRKGPGTKFAKASWSPVDKYFSMKVIKTKGDWIQIQDGVGDKAWIYKPLVWMQ